MTLFFRALRRSTLCRANLHGYKMLRRYVNDEGLALPHLVCPYCWHVKTKLTWL